MVNKFTGLIAIGMLLISTLNSNAIGESDQRKAVIKDLKNKVELKYGASVWREASRGQLLRPGTSIRTGSLSKVELSYPDGSLTRIGSRTVLTVLDKSYRAVRVDSGKVWFKVAKKSSGFRIYSPTAVAAITGTEGYVEFNNDEKLETNDIKTIDKNDLSHSGFNTGLVEGHLNVYKQSNENGDLIGNPSEVNAGQVLNFNGGSFSVKDIGVENILNQNLDVSTPDSTASNNTNGNISSNKLDRTNPTTEQVPSTINSQQNINNSPTTGSLEVIIK
ncbi:MAG: FecR domain-containing protein [Candidatus Sericytochromatia bacterium]|nr:FecR domain-containing protein [Candidatus Sericytochromatia bacterium]